jgi:hypothetical protein
MGSGGMVSLFLTSALDGGEWSDSHLRERDTGTYRTGGGVGENNFASVRY